MEELKEAAKSKSSTSFAGPLVRAFLALQRPDLANDALPLVKDAEQQASLLIKMGRREEAEDLLAKRDAQAGGLLNWFKGSS